MKMMKIQSLALAVVLLNLTAWRADASIITWGAPTLIGGVSDVSTNGTLVGAFNLGGFGGVANTTINGVAFTAVSIATSTNSPVNIGSGAATLTPHRTRQMS